MESLSGLGNWRLTVRRQSDGIVILRAVTCDEDAVLPDEMFGLPVIEIADRALSAGQAEPEGEEVSVTCGIPKGEWSNRNIRCLTLPAALRTVSDYAFLNCSSMEKITLHDSVEAFAVSALMNCRSFREIRLLRDSPGQGPTLAAIIPWLSRELDVTIEETGAEKLRLIFPEFIEQYIENEPTHFFYYNIESAGFPYHHVFHDRQLSLADYDSLWSRYLSAEHDEGAATRLAWWRLRYPRDLSEKAENEYRNYLCGNLGPAFDMAVKTRDISGLKMLLKKENIPSENLEAARAKAAETGFTEAVALLLEAQHQRFSSGRRRKYEL